MRVIAGKYKGRKLYSPDNYDIRPTSDKVKEAMFSILTADIYDSSVLDLFAGTGSLGIEALSRGARRCLFADASRAGVKLVKSNLEHCAVEEETKILAGDYRKVLANLSAKIGDGLEEPPGIILLDPPYNKGLLVDAIQLISEGNILAEDGIIVAEHRKEEELPDTIGRYHKEKDRRYGIVKLSIYK